MNRLFRSILLLMTLGMTGSCSNVGFRSPQPEDSGQACTGSVCDLDHAYSWHESGFGICSKPCNGGNQTETVECRRTSDDAVVPDSNCSGTKPVSTKSCNTQICTTTYTWNLTSYGTCSKTCGGGVQTRTVICQDQLGNTTADANCPTPKPAPSQTCNTDACVPPVTYTWQTTVGTCSVQCGGGTASDTVICKKSDSSTVADSFCSATPKPSTAAHACNTQACPIAYTYAWEPGAYGTCSKTCGDGSQTRSISCKRNDGAYVADTFCTATKPTTTQACKIADCPVGTPVTQTATVTPASNSVDVVLVIDDSFSMKADQLKLASRLINLVTDLDNLNIDYQICLTTTDAGYYKGAPIKWVGTNSVIFNRATPDKNNVFINTVNSLGAEWSSDEQPIKSTYLMLRDFGPNSAANSGCFRPRATLTGIMISDEDEHSVGGNASESSAQYVAMTTENYPATLISLVHSTFDQTGFVKPFIWNSIIVRPGDKTCEAQEDAEGSPSFPGTWAANLSNTTGGQLASICDADYANNMTLIKNKIVNSMPGLTMNCTPTGLATVTFNPNFATSVSQTGNQLKFTPALPENTVVTAKYTCP